MHNHHPTGAVVSILFAGMGLLGACTMAPAGGQATSPSLGPSLPVSLPSPAAPQQAATLATHTAQTTTVHTNTVQPQREPPRIRCYSDTRTRSKHYAVLEELQAQLQLSTLQLPAFDAYAKFMQRQHSRVTTHCNQPVAQPQPPARPLDLATHQQLLKDLHHVLDRKQRRILRQHLHKYSRPTGSKTGRPPAAQPIKTEYLNY